MDKALINLHKMSLLSRNFAAFRRFFNVNSIPTSPSHISNTGCKETEPKSIYNDLDNNPPAIFDYIRKNKESLTGQSCLEVLKKLSKCKPESSFQINSLSENEDFLVLCNELNKGMNTLNTFQKVEVFQLLPMLGISSNNTIFRSLLKNIQNNSQPLPAKHTEDSKEISREKEEIYVTDSLEFPKSHGINKNLPIYSLCCELFEMTKKSEPKMSKLNLLLNGISKSLEINSTPTTGVAKSIFTSFSYFPDILVTQHAALLKKIINILIYLVPKFEKEELLQLLLVITIAGHNLKDGDAVENMFHDIDFVNSLINALIEMKSLSLEEGAKVMSRLQYLGHQHEPLLDYLSFKCYENQSLLFKMESDDFFLLVTGLASFNYKPRGWKNIEKLLIEHKCLEACHKNNLINFVCKLAMQDFYPENLISKAFSLSVQECNSMKPVTKNHLRLLYQLVKTLNPSYTGSWLSKPASNIISHRSNLFLSDYPFLPIIRKAFGGPEYVQTKVETTLGHLLDHIIVINKEGFPVSINNEYSETDGNEVYATKFITSIENIKIPTESKIIGILFKKPGAYQKNTKKLRGMDQATIRTLEALNYIIIPINEKHFKNLKEQDQIQYFKMAIKIKYPSFQTPNNTQ